MPHNRSDIQNKLRARLTMRAGSQKNGKRDCIGRHSSLCDNNAQQLRNAGTFFMSSNNENTSDARLLIAKPAMIGSNADKGRRG
jgi:hypothetical protein